MILQDFLFISNKTNKKIAIYGDSILDEYHQVNVTRISPEFPIPIMLSEQINPFKIVLGGAANIAAQLVNFNVKIQLYSLIDQHFLDNACINTNNCVKIDKNISRKKRFYDKNFPICRWDIENENYGYTINQLNEILNKLFNQPVNADIIIFSDYNKGVFSSNFHEKLIKDNITIVDPKGKDIDKWIGCTVFKPNAHEALLFSGKKEWKDQCMYFKNRLKCNSVVITNEANGVRGLCENEYFEYIPVNIKNLPESVIGAGDNFVSFFSLSLANGFNIPQSAEIAFEIASLYVQKKHNEPIKQRQLYPNSKFILPEELVNRDYKLVMTNGCFDIIHSGHIEALKFAKSKGDKLVVAVNSDNSIKRLKGCNRPINDLQARMSVLEALEMVDYVVSFEEDTPYELINLIKPDVLVKSAEWQGKAVAGEDLVKEMIFAPHVENKSTTNIIEKIQSFL